MNKEDRENLEFLLSLKTQRDWWDWAKAVGQDDIDYAMSLIDQAQAELYDDIQDVSEAQKLLSRF